MELKSFIAGAIAGVVISVSVVRLMGHSDPRTDTATTNEAVGNISPEAVGNSAEDSLVPVPQATSPAEDVGDIDSVVEGIEERGRNTGNDIVQPDIQTSDRLSQVPTGKPHNQLLDQYADAGPDATAPSNNRRELENDPRDYEWSYFMEQSIGQYLASHPEIMYFDIAGIECRSTICEIQSFGVDENAGPRWGLIVHDLRNQPWNDFGQTGSSSSTIDGRLVIITHLRRQTEEE